MVAAGMEPSVAPGVPVLSSENTEAYYSHSSSKSGDLFQLNPNSQGLKRKKKEAVTGEASLTCLFLRPLAP